MPRLIWYMQIIGAFGTGLATATLHYSSATRIPAEPLAAVADWQRQVAGLQGHIRTQEAELTMLRQQVQVLSEIPPVVEQAVLPAPRPGRMKPQKSRTSAPAQMPEKPAAPTPTVEAPSPPTEQAALTRLRQYLNETEGMRPQERRGQVRIAEPITEIDDLAAVIGEPAVPVLVVLS